MGKGDNKCGQDFLEENERSFIREECIVLKLKSCFSSKFCLKNGCKNTVSGRFSAILTYICQIKFRHNYTSLYDSAYYITYFHYFFIVLFFSQGVLTQSAPAKEKPEMKIIDFDATQTNSIGKMHQSPDVPRL